MWTAQSCALGYAARSEFNTRARTEPAFAGVLTTMVPSCRDIRIRRDRYKLIRKILERGDTTNLLIVALATTEQKKEPDNHDSKVVKSLSYLPRP
jgi:hypothetical protein